MEDYETKGTPWNIVIDPQGVIRYSEFLAEKDSAITLIDQLNGKDPEE